MDYCILKFNQIVVWTDKNQMIDILWIIMNSHQLGPFPVSSFHPFPFLTKRKPSILLPKRLEQNYQTFVVFRFPYRSSSILGSQREELFGTVMRSSAQAAKLPISHWCIASVASTLAHRLAVIHLKIRMRWPQGSNAMPCVSCRGIGALCRHPSTSPTPGQRCADWTTN